MIRALIAGLLLATSVTAALAADAPLKGDRARLSDLRAQRRAQVISYSKAIDLMSLDPTVSGATLDIYSVATGRQLTLSLPAATWEGPLPGRRFRYTSNGDPRIKIVLVSGRLLRISLKGSAGFPLGSEPQVSIAARLTIGATRFCLSFGGTAITKDDGKRFVAHGAPPPGACVPAPNDVPAPFCADKADGTACDDGKTCTGASRCHGGVCSVGESPNCRTETPQGSPNDKSYCDLTTGSCVATPPCPAYENGNLCRPYDPSIFPAGSSDGCAYRTVRCDSDGCGATCDPATGQCVENTNCTCTQPQFPDAPCEHGACRTEYCISNLDDVPNCDGQTFANCAAENPNHCVVPIPDNPDTFQGCQEGVGCVYTYINCAQSQPFGPLDDPCLEYRNEPTLPGCCNVVNKDCAGRFGNAPGYTYSCDPANGTCSATPQ